MVGRQKLIKICLLLVLVISTSLGMASAKPYDTLVWKAHNDLPYHLVIRFDKDKNSFVIRRLSTKKLDRDCQWEEFVIQPNVKKYGEEYIYSFLKQLFSLTKPYTDFSQDAEESEAYLCKKTRDDCVRVSTQLFDRENGEFTFYKYISQLE